MAGVETSGSRTRAIVVVFSRPSDFSREADWDAWYDEEHLPATAVAAGAWVVTRWETIDRPPGFSGPVGFTHMAVYEFDDPDRAPGLLDHLADRGSAAGRPWHPAHAVIGVDAFAPVGRWSQKTEPHEGLTGQVVAYVGANDPAREAEWHRWLDDVHVPDMMGSGAFTGTSRWGRLQPARFGLNFFTIYDVTIDPVAEAVRLSGEAMRPAAEAGRLMDCHTGGLRGALRPAGRYGPTGYRPGG